MVQLWRAFGHLVPLFLIIVLVICIITYVVSGKRKLDFKRVVVNLLFGLSIIGILLVTVSPEDFGHGMQKVVNLIPFVGM